MTMTLTPFDSSLVVAHPAVAILTFHFGLSSRCKPPYPRPGETAGQGGIFSQFLLIIPTGTSSLGSSPTAFSGSSLRGSFTVGRASAGPVMVWG